MKMIIGSDYCCHIARLTMCSLVALVFLQGCVGQPRTVDLLGHDPRFGDPSSTLIVTDTEDGSWNAKLVSNDTNWHQQSKPDYCWAACTQSVMSLQGHDDIPTQSELWEKFASNPMFKEHPDAATFEEICFALVPEYQTTMPSYFVVDTESTRVNDMVRALASGEPVIVGLLSGGIFGGSGHAYVLHAMDYTESEDTGASKGDIVRGGVSIVRSVKGFFSGENDQTETKPLESKDNTHTATRLYLFNPQEPVEEAPEYGGGMTDKSIDEIADSFGFALSPVIARRYLDWRTSWLKKHDQGPGIYVVNPADRDGKPLSIKSVNDL